MTDKPPLTVIALDRVTMRAEVTTNDAVHRWLQSVAETMDRQMSDQIEEVRAARDDLLTFGSAAMRIPGAPDWAIRALLRHRASKTPKYSKRA